MDFANPRAARIIETFCRPDSLIGKYKIAEIDG
jgi:hypothetical protein